MKGKRFSEGQIIGILKEAEAGVALGKPACFDGSRTGSRLENGHAKHTDSSGFSVPK
jgi:hypothetical protein